MTNTWLGISFLLNLWIIPVALYYTIEVAKWKGPNDWNGPISTFLILSIGSASLSMTVWMCFLMVLMVFTP